MPNTSTVNPKHLTPAAATAWEAQLFAERHEHEYYICEKNSRAMIGYLEANGLPLIYENFERAFKHLRGEGKLLVPSTTAFAQMTSDEVEALAQKNGIPRYDTSGKVIGYDWGPEFQHVPSIETAASPSRRRRSEMQHPEDLDRNPTKREVAMWDADRFTEWLEATGNVGRALPEYLR